PPEEMLISPMAKANLDESPFTCHKTEKTRSDLISDGIDAELVNSASTGRPNWMEMDAIARDVVVDQMTMDNPADKSMQTIEVRDVAIRCDWDGDGIAELRQVLVVGDKIASNEEIEESPFAAAVSKRMPHRHTGISLYDELADIQVIKSELMRTHARWSQQPTPRKQRSNRRRLEELQPYRPYGLSRWRSHSHQRAA
ncbi:MAG: hypothetical protein B7X03_04005, partial [Parcubacteria group bacterium 21-58-10]